jgi:hypothetical protein
MKIASRVTGEVIEWNDEGAQTLIDAGIYDMAEKKKEPPKNPKKQDSPTKVEPMTTEDMPVPVKPVPS